MKKRAFLFLLIVFSVFMLFPLSVYADTGPKPSVRITFENMGDEVCYGTLLSKHESTGPASVWDGDENHIADTGIDRAVFDAFVNYRDTDGYYYLQQSWLCSETKELNWTYYPPSSFKILLYYPATGAFAVSEICERYAFDSYFTVNMADVQIDSVTSESSVLSARKNYDYTKEAVSFCYRFIITLLLEIAIAPLFGFRQRKSLLLIGGINFITQAALNVGLNVTCYYHGQLQFVLNYLLFELLVFLIEAIVYVIFLPKVDLREVKPIKAIFYAFTANVLSLAAGLIISKIIPAIF